MKKVIILLILPVILLSCSDAPETYNNENAAKIVSTFSDLPAPSESNSGFLYYVISEDSFYYSNGTTYVYIDLSGVDGIDGVDGANGSDATLPYRTLILDIGGWNMDTLLQKSISLDSYITVDFSILSVSVTIYRDQNGDSFDFYYKNAGHWFYLKPNNILYLNRTDSGMFDSSDFDDDSINRGKVLILYLEN